MVKEITISQQIINAIKVAINTDTAVLHEPSFIGNEWKYIKDCLNSTFVSSVGKYVERFESDLQEFTGARHAIAVGNGTAALHIALLLAGIKEGDEVLIPALTFVATANAVNYCGATPHFVDSEYDTLGIDPIALREYLKTNTETRNKNCVNKKTGRVIRAIVPMHTFGHPVNIEDLMSVAQDFNLALVEDAAESLGSTVNGKHTGTFGLMGTLSFNGNKTITTGGGGAIITNNTELAKHAKHLTTTAKVPHRWEYVHDEVGYNYRLPNINAALGCAQLEQLPDILALKRHLFTNYQSAFRNLSNVNLVSETEGTKSNFWLQAMLLDDSVADQRDEILDNTNNVGLMTRPVWKLLNHLIPYRHCPQMKLPVATSLSQRLINLPSSALLATKEVL